MKKVGILAIIWLPIIVWAVILNSGVEPVKASGGF